MAFIFPEDKADFTAPNGVTYAWDGNKWRTKKYALNDEKLAEYLPKNNPRATGALTVSPVDWMEQSRFCVTNGSSAYFILKPSSTPERSQIQYWGMTEGDRDLATVGYVKNQLTVGGEEIDFGKFVKQEEFDTDQAAQDQLIAENRRSIEELEVTKGPVSRYECKGTSFNVASRNGDLYVSDATAANVTAISFAPFDLNGNPTRPVGAGDIVEFVESANLKTAGQVSRFRVVSGDDPTALTVAYLNGENNFEVGETEEVYIYPQNEETASKEYVDDNFLPLTGGNLTGQLNTDSLIKSTRNTGYGLQLKPDNGDAISWLHTNGTFHFGGKGTIDGDLDIETGSDSGVRILGSLKVKQTGSTISQSNCFEAFGDRVNYYGSTSSDENIATVGHVKTAVASVDVDLSGYVEGRYKITKINGNYYIEDK